MDENMMIRSMLSFGEKNSKLWTEDPAAWYRERQEMRKFLDALDGEGSNVYHRVQDKCFQFGLTSPEKNPDHNDTIVFAVCAIVRHELKSLGDWTRKDHRTYERVNAYHVAAMCHLQCEIERRMMQTHVGE